MTDQSRMIRQGFQNIGQGFKPGFYPDALWEDQNFDVLALTVPGNNDAPDPYVIPTTGLVLPSFPDGAAVVESAGSKELLHAWKVGTSIYPHVHLVKLDAGAGSVYLGFEYRIVRGTTIVSGTKTLTVAVTDRTVLDEEKYTEFEAIDLSTITDVGAQVTFRFFRDPTNAADDFAGDIAITTIGWHLQVNSGGSRLIGSK